MKFNVYSRFVIEIIRMDERWVAFRIGVGIKAPVDNLSIPHNLKESELRTFLDDIFHEFAMPGKSIEKLE